LTDLILVRKQAHQVETGVVLELIDVEPPLTDLSAPSAGFTLNVSQDVSRPILLRGLPPARAGCADDY
jgi:hypothetical protein